MPSLREKARQKRKKRIRSRVGGTAERPRMVIYKSMNNIYVQAVDDVNSKIIAASSTINKDVKSKIKKSSNSEAAKAVGKDIADKLKKLKIDSIVFDRGGYLYHGQIKALADSAREAGIKF